ncbi:uncharacterized protein METZ01_LOCUS49967 [marine metagenome]|uniref:Uncharacterized protein n=1 Tax=marine metagenome TaxID=408172 RepID=A0A381S7L1_9ZZZZ
MSVEAIEMDRKIQPAVARQLVEIVCIRGDVVDSKGTGN